MNLKSNILALGFSIIFMLFLILPNLFLLGKDSSKDKTESSKSLRKQLKEFDGFYKDSFGLKTTLIENYASFKRGLLKEPMWPNSTFKGKNGWYFLGNDYNQVLDDSFGSEFVTAQEMQQVKQGVLDLKEYFDKQNIPFYIVVPPNKHRIYSEYLPYSLDHKPTRLERLRKYLKEEIDFEIIDLTDTLLSRKKDLSLYYKTDSHWNDYGAFLGYSYTMNRLDKKLTSGKVFLSDYSIATDGKVKSDILEQVFLSSDTNEVTLVKKTKELSHEDYYSHLKQVFTNDSSKYKLIMYRDSFANAWIPFFNESFGETIYLRGETIDKRFVEEEKPDLVIIEIVERNLFSSLKKFKAL